MALSKTRMESNGSGRHLCEKEGRWDNQEMDPARDAPHLVYLYDERPDLLLYFEVSSSQTLCLSSHIL